jgi:hypothetical protein
LGLSDDLMFYIVILNPVHIQPIEPWNGQNDDLVFNEHIFGVAGFMGG